MSALEWLAMARHGESVGNVARHEAEAAGLNRIDLPTRDPDVPLSEAGRRQAAALGRWLAQLPEGEHPTAVYCSPYIRAAETARVAVAGLPDTPLVYDERLRDRDAGTFYGLTARGIAALFPEEAARKKALGKFYYRPPGGESWTDVALRLRAVLADIEREQPGGRVLIVAHDALVVLTRYIVEGMSEEEILDAERTLVPNGSVTAWTRSGGRLRLVTANATGHLNETGLSA